MGLLTKEDLDRNSRYQYSWKATPGDNPKIIDYRDSSKVNREEGYEVLDFINSYAAQHFMTRKEDGFHLEKLVHMCPTYMRGEMKKWIDQALSRR